MRVSGLHVDGYGVLADVDVQDLPPGLSVICGPNEAGKSTLLDFVRGVLFGFPDRRSRLPYREPLRGGRHGGRIDLVDESGQAWSLIRYVGTRLPSLVGPDGSERSAGELAALFGGVDGEVFRSVFAFGLAELVSLETLDSEAVRDAVFSAGVLGAGRSSGRAAAALRARREALARPRQREAPANRLAAELADVEEALRLARREASGHQSRRADLERSEQEVRAARCEADGLRRQLGEFDRLMTCWPLHCRAEAARRELDSLGPVPQHELALLAEQRLVEQLLGERSGHQERVRRASELASQLAGIERQRSELLALLVPLAAGRSGACREPAADAGLDAGGGSAAPTAPATSRLLAEARLLLSEQAVVLASLDAARGELERALDAVEAHLADSAAAPGVTPRPVVELDAAERTLRELTSELAERERLASGLAAARQAEAELDLQQAASSTAPRRLTAAAVAAVLVASGALAALALHDLHSGGALALAQAVLAAALALSALLITLAARRSLGRAAARRRRDGDAEAEPGAPAWWAACLAACEARIEVLGGGLGLAPPVSAARVGTMLAELAHERSARLHLDTAGRERSRLEAAASGARRRAVNQHEALETLRSRAAAVACAASLAPGLSLDELVGALEAGEELAELDRARRRVAAPLAQLREQTASFEQRIRELWSRLGAHSAPPPDDAIGLLEELQRSLHAALERRESTAKLERTLSESADELARQLGNGESAARLRAELQRGDLLYWERAQQETAGMLEAASRRHESAVATRHELRRQLDELERSSQIADLELARGSRREELEQVLGEWVALTLAEALLDATLARYEREHQPRVVARAGELFSQVTAGRYERLVARCDGGSARAQAIDALTRRGERVDSAALSRGTAEQLYLCLRLAYACTVAERGVALPIVLDDVLVNFDPGRARAAAAAVAATARRHQVLAFTCHPDTAAMMLEVAGEGALVELDRCGPASAA